MLRVKGSVVNIEDVEVSVEEFLQYIIIDASTASQEALEECPDLTKEQIIQIHNKIVEKLKSTFNS